LLCITEPLTSNKTRYLVFPLLEIGTRSGVVIREADPIREAEAIREADSLRVSDTIREAIVIMLI
jgi:hypothetical protein